MDTDRHFKCPKCPPEEQRSRGLDELREHIARRHLEFRLYSCPKCQRGFVTPQTALSHIRIECKVDGALPMSAFTSNLLAQDRSFFLELQNAERESVVNFVNETIRRYSKNYRPPAAEKTDGCSQTDITYYDVISRQDFITNYPAMQQYFAAAYFVHQQQQQQNQGFYQQQQQPNNAYYVQGQPQPALQMALQAEQQPQQGQYESQPEYYEPPPPPQPPQLIEEPEAETEAPPEPAAEDEPPIKRPRGPRTPPEQQIVYDSPDSPDEDNSADGNDHKVLRIRHEAYELCSSTETGAEVPSDVADEEKYPETAGEEPVPPPQQPLFSGVNRDHDYEYAPPPPPASDFPAPPMEPQLIHPPMLVFPHLPIVMTLRSQPAPEVYRVQGFGDMDIDEGEEDVHTADEDSSSRKDSDTDAEPIDERKRKKRRMENYQRVVREDHVCEYRGCCDLVKVPTMCQFCEGSHLNVDCSTVTDLSDRKLILRLKDYCYRCGGTHRRENVVQCDDVVCGLCGQKGHIASICSSKRHTDVLRDLKEDYRNFRMPSTDQSRKLRRIWEKKVDELVRSLHKSRTSRGEERGERGGQRGRDRDGGRDRERDRDRDRGERSGRESRSSFQKETYRDGIAS